MIKKQDTAVFPWVLSHHHGGGVPGVVTIAPLTKHCHHSKDATSVRIACCYWWWWLVCFVFFSLYWDCEFCLWLVRDSTTNVPLPHCLRDCYNQLSGWPPEQGQRVISCKNRPNQFQMSFKFHFVSLNFLTTGAYLPLSKKMSRARLNFFKCSSVRLLETTWKHRQQQMCLLRQGGNNKVCFLQQKQHCQEACGCYARPDLVD